MNQIKFSVIIPAYNRVNLLLRALNSVKKQTVSPYEVIVVDDCSEELIHDSIIDYIQLKVHLIRLPCKTNAAFARNVGVNAATGNWLAFLDSDDEWSLTHLADILSILKNNREVKFLVSVFGVYSFYPIANAADALFVDGVDLRTSGFVVEKRTFFLVGGFDCKLNKHQDWDLALRIARITDIYVLQNLNIIIDSNSPDRMSSTHNPSATLLFLEKHRLVFNDVHINRILELLVSVAAYGRNQSALCEYDKIARQAIGISNISVKLAFVMRFPRIYVMISKTINYAKKSYKKLFN